MLHIREDPIHCVNDKCIYPSGKNAKHLPQLHNYNDLYGSEDYSQGRFKDLGVPVFVMKISYNEPVQEEKMHIQPDGVISDDLFDKLFDCIEKKTKSKPKNKTRKNRKKGKKEKK